VDFKLAVKERRKSTALVGSGGKVASVENRQAARIAAEDFAKDRKVFGLSLAAEPLNFVLVAMGAETQQRGDTRVEPAELIGKIHGAQRTDFVALAEGNLATAGAGAAVEGED